MRVSSVLYSLVGLCLVTLAASQSSSGPYDSALIGSRHPFYNLTQKLDHSSGDNTTFKQRYQMVTDYFQPGGPILFAQSAEQDIVPVESSDLFDMAKELRGLVIGLEHRFFGTSLPQSYNGSASSFAPLTLGNVLEDAAAFVDFVKKNVTGAANSEVIVQVGSYGGNLALLAFPV
ncbi:hypothetical protein H2200_008417 [Cladophialophora chaetospira]|uniref:Uncharacterized protein n=1 Tax=Cladophialophora chaetospira TaxID=386627 RepID=A0AA39CG33_9EURO|nr:hypothetical protein H2200_008417 [Cladophialophora chaetospira]